MNKEQIAMDYFATLELQKIKDKVTTHINRLRKEKSSFFYEGFNMYEVYIDTLSNPNDNQLQHLINLLQIPYTSNQNITEEDIYDIFKMVAVKLDQTLELKGNFSFEHSTNDEFCLFYHEKDFIPDSKITNLLDNASQSYQQNYQRFKNLPDLIMDAIKLKRSEDYIQKLKNEYNQLASFFKEAKLNRLKKRMMKNNIKHYY